MDVTPQLIKDVEFRQALRGYDPDEVDLFLQRVGASIAQLDGRLTEALSRAEAAEGRLDGGGARPARSGESPSEETITRTLVLAQQTADKLIGEARDEAASTLAQVQNEAAELRGAAQAEAEEMTSSTRLETNRLRETTAAESSELRDTTVSETDAMRVEAELVLATARSEAQSEREAILREVESEARAVAEATRTPLLEEIRGLETTRDELISDNSLLVDHIANERETVQGSLDRLQEAIDDPDTLRSVEPPQLASVDYEALVADDSETITEGELVEPAEEPPAEPELSNKPDVPELFVDDDASVEETVPVAAVESELAGDVIEPATLAEIELDEAEGQEIASADVVPDDEPEDELVASAGDDDSEVETDVISTVEAETDAELAAAEADQDEPTMADESEEQGESSDRESAHFFDIEAEEAPEFDRGSLDSVAVLDDSEVGDGVNIDVVALDRDLEAEDQAPTVVVADPELLDFEAAEVSPDLGFVEQGEAVAAAEAELAIDADEMDGEEGLIDFEIDELDDEIAVIDLTEAADDGVESPDLTQRFDPISDSVEADGSSGGDEATGDAFLDELRRAVSDESPSQDDPAMVAFFDEDSDGPTRRFGRRS